MKTVTNIMVIFLLLLFVGCSTLPPPAQMKAEVVDFELPKLPEDGKAIVYIVRPASVGWLVRFNVFVDDEEPESEMGYTRASEYIYFNLEPGEHSILSVAENVAETNVTAASGDIIFIQQEVNMGFIMARNSLLKLQDYEGKYHVKHLTLGTIIQVDK